jgi:hypothetical protein
MCRPEPAVHIQQCMNLHSKIFLTQIQNKISHSESTCRDSRTAVALKHRRHKKGCHELICVEEIAILKGTYFGM